MFSALTKYRQFGYFTFTTEDRLADVCNAPKNFYGVYIVYATEKYNRTIVYIGASKGNKEDKKPDAYEGLREHFLHGRQFGERLGIAWPKHMAVEHLRAIEVHWYVTNNHEHRDYPCEVREQLLLDYFAEHGVLPRWNKWEVAY